MDSYAVKYACEALRGSGPAPFEEFWRLSAKQQRLVFVVLALKKGGLERHESDGSLRSKGGLIALCNKIFGIGAINLSGGQALQARLGGLFSYYPNRRNRPRSYSIVRPTPETETFLNEVMAVLKAGVDTIKMPDVEPSVLVAEMRRAYGVDRAVRLLREAAEQVLQKYPGSITQSELLAALLQEPTDG